MENNLLEKCLFYKLEDSSIEVCVYANGEWEDSFVAIIIGTKLIMLHGESNLQHGEKPNRKIIANLSTHDWSNTIPLKGISIKETSSIFRESIKGYFKNLKK